MSQEKKIENKEPATLTSVGGLSEAAVLKAKAEDFTKPFQQTIIYMHKSFGDSFRTGSRGGKKWMGNASATKIIKQGSRPLVDKGKLRKHRAIRRALKEREKSIDGLIERINKLEQQLERITDGQSNV